MGSYGRTNTWWDAGRIGLVRAELSWARMYVTMLNWDVRVNSVCDSEVTDIDYYSFLCPSLVHVHRITQLQSSCATHNQTHREEARGHHFRMKWRSIHTNRFRLRLLIATNNMIQYECSHGAIATMTLNPIQPIGCVKQITVAIAPCEWNLKNGKA